MLILEPVFIMDGWEYVEAPRSFTHLGAKGVGVNHLIQIGMIFFPSKPTIVNSRKGC